MFGYRCPTMHTFIPMYCTILYETMLYVCRRIRKVFVAQWKAQKTAVLRECFWSRILYSYNITSISTTKVDLKYDLFRQAQSQGVTHKFYKCPGQEGNSPLLSCRGEPRTSGRLCNLSCRREPGTSGWLILPVPAM